MLCFVTHDQCTSYHASTSALPSAAVDQIRISWTQPEGVLMAGLERWPPPDHLMLLQPGWQRPMPHMLPPAAAEWQWLSAGPATRLVLETAMAIDSSNATVSSHSALH
jgi:hypothetical protein